MSANAFAVIYQAWMGRMQINPNQAARVIGTSPSTSYEYAAGTSLPPRTRLPQLAAAMGVPLADLTTAVEADRAAATTPTTAAPAAGW